MAATEAFEGRFPRSPHMLNFHSNGCFTPQAPPRLFRGGFPAIHLLGTLPAWRGKARSQPPLLESATRFRFPTSEPHSTLVVNRGSATACAAAALCMGHPALLQCPGVGSPRRWGSSTLGLRCLTAACHAVSREARQCEMIALASGGDGCPCEPSLTLRTRTRAPFSRMSS